MTQIYNKLVSMKHLVLDRGNWLRIATWLEINEMIDWKTIYQSPFKQANKGPTVESDPSFLVLQMYLAL